MLIHIPAVCAFSNWPNNRDIEGVSPGASEETEKKRGKFREQVRAIRVSETRLQSNCEKK